MAGDTLALAHPREKVEEVHTRNVKNISDDQYKYKIEIVWTRVIILGLLHLMAVYGFVLRFEMKPQTFIFYKTLTMLSVLGITGGAHRLWSHKCYKANYFAQTLLMMMASLTYQNSIFTWCRDHRLHHKYSETDADPHNAKRGFFFSHMGWLMVKKHKLVIEKGREIDLSDLKANPIIMFQHRHYHKILLCGALFTIFVPIYFWGEQLKITIFSAIIYRYIVSVNLTWCINSLAHLYGNKPYNKKIGPTEQPLMKYFGYGEGFHNYHHSFPWDYKAGEHGHDARNITTLMIDLFAWFGWVTERQTASETLIASLIKNNGDGTYKPVPNTTVPWLFNIKRYNFINIRNLIIFVIYMAVI